MSRGVSGRHVCSRTCIWPCRSLLALFTLKTSERGFSLTVFSNAKQAVICVAMPILSAITLLSQIFMSGRGGERPAGRRGGRGGGPRRDRPQRYEASARHHQQRGASASGQDRFNYRRSHGRIRYLKWDEITQLAGGTTEGVVDAVQRNEAGFLTVFSHSESCSNPRILRALIKILYLLVKSKENQLASRILGHIYSPDGNSALFCFKVDCLIKSMPTDKQQQYMQENLNALHYLIEIGLFCVHTIPTTILDAFPKPSIASTVRALGHSGQDIQQLQTRCAELDQQFDLVRKQLEPPPISSGVSAPQEDDLVPPNNFTDIPILPQSEELQLKYKPFLRANKVEGPYQGWDHYLDVQFRLLREDFIAPLREGINDDFSAHRNSSVRPYKHVHVLAPVCLFSGIGFEISFDATPFQRTNWEHSRRLIFGSLLCLSNDNFSEGSIIFATVVKREAKQLKEGRLIVKFEGDVSGFQIDPSIEYMMVESTAYFEAYRHVLLALQKASLLKDTMPFKHYIVECELNNPQSPLHIRRFNAPNFNLSKVLKCKCREAGNVKIIVESTWPQFTSTCLDESQFKALKMALQQEITCIQGPPGTGKTFIGVKLVQALLYNRLAWDPEKNSPILLVCYTNHALDQFLEEIIDANAEDKLSPPDIVRIGGRCKSEKLGSFVLAKRISDARSNKSLPSGMYRGSRDLRDNIDALKEYFMNLQQQMSSVEQNILPLSALRCVMSEDHIFQLSKGMPTEPGKEMEVWLNLWKPTEYEEMEEYEQMALQQFEEDEDIKEDEHIHEESNSEDEMVAVDEEATLLQDERIIEGEEEILFKARAAHRAQTEIPRQRGKSGHRPGEWQTVQISDKERRKRIKKGFEYNKPIKAKEASKVKDLRFISNKERWRMYHYWVQQYLRFQKQQLEIPAARYNRVCSDYLQMKQDIDCHVARGADIIGMTTTGAAKYHHILKGIHPKIVVIEEAAEVFESHVITSLSPSVQQLVLIGDHQQLKPKPNHYELEKKYNLDISLFQRLIENGIPHVTLTVQHRMRPDIASLIHPAIYPVLHNGPRAIEQGEHKVAGVGHNLFFLHHEQPEQRQNPNESLSHVNTHEADFMVALCRYLLKQGYKPTQITLLTMYKGQLLKMKSRMKRSEFGGVRVAAVDDYQGEENDIILLSLVRSNSDKKIGFLKIENRVCVALSRARKGLYVIGNFNMLRGRDDTIWPKILRVVEEKQRIGDTLLLQCQNHPNEIVRAKVATDFSKCPEGGCTKPCNYRLTCGHGCTRLCHPWDREHKQYKCQKMCDKLLPCQHKCRSKCYECINVCGPCSEKVDKIIPRCGHRVRLECHKDPWTFPCSVQCRKQLRCGHLCQKLCSQPCDTQCPVPVEKTLFCGHIVKVACHKRVDRVKCSVPCKALLQCEHECKGTCGTCQQGRLHMRCQSECGRTLVCGHICNSPCAAECPPCMQTCSNYCLHSKCPKHCYEPCDPCAEPCNWSCQHLQCTRKCGELCNRPRCHMPCHKRLKCGHLCIGLCGDKCPSLCRECDKDKVTEIFFGTEDEPDARFVQLQDCKHVFESSGLDQWMEREESSEIQFKKCPKCSTLIRTSLRYYNEVKKVHNHFEEIKKKQLQMLNIDQIIMPKLRVLFTKKFCHDISANVKKIASLVNPDTRPRYILPNCLSAIQNQLAILPIMNNLYSEVAQMKRISWQLKDCKISCEALHREIEDAQRFLMQDTLTDQQLNDIESEIKRLECIVRLLKLYFLINERKVAITQEEKETLNEYARAVYYSGVRQTPKISEKVVSELISYFEKKYKLQGLTEAERVEIVKAIGLAKGHWFKCPNGHYYCIADCGGAMVEAKCPECDAIIGGANHTLRSDNSLAPEIDGAQYAAWSDQANMRNYQFDF